MEDKVDVAEQVKAIQKLNMGGSFSTAKFFQDDRTLSQENLDSALSS